MIIKPGTIFKDGSSEYVIEEVIGEGGFGFVYKAKNLTNSLTYAIKTVSTSFQNDSKFEAFQNEIKMATQIISSNVINYKFTHDGTVFPELPPYIIMDYANQGTLTDILNKQKLSNEFFDNSQLSEMFHQLSKGMETINEKLVHRDIKPDNILVDNSLLKITDFGLSKFAGEKTRTMSFKGYGTLKYIAPEAWNNDINTIQMDIYSMGVVFYELATLQHPYEVKSGDVSLWREAHLYSIPENPKNINRNISSTVASLIMKMLEKSTSNRFANWKEILVYLKNDKTEKSDIDGLIDNMLNIRLQKDSNFQKEEAEEERRNKEITDFCKLVKYQYDTSIFVFLQDLVQKFNSKSPNGSMKIVPNNNYDQKTIKNTITLVSGEKIEIEIVALLEKDFVRIQEYNNFGETIRRTQVKMPLLNKKRILAWGRLNTHEQTGFNILLIEKTGEIYGEWVLMENTNSGFARSRRPEPFGFKFSEIEKEIQYVNTTHIYNSNILPLDKNKFYEYILKYN